MNPAKSEFTADLLLHVLANEPGVQLYFGILSSSIKKAEVKGDEDKVFTKEIADPLYARQPVAFTKPNHSFVKLVNDIHFPRTSQKWDKVTHFGVFDAPTGGNTLLLKPTGSVTSVESGEIVAILSSEFSLYVGQNAFTIPEAQ